MRRLSTDTPTPDPQCLFQKFETVAANHGRLRGSAGHEKRIQPSASYSRPIFQTSDTRASQENYTAKDIFWEPVFAIKIMISDRDKNFQPEE
jgi:hypothetical protein